MTIQSILRSKNATVISVPPGTLISEVVQILALHKIGALPVMENDELLGMLSERDIVRAMARQTGGVRALTAGTLMTVPRGTVSPRDTIVYAMQIMTERRIRHLPAIENGRVIGIVSIGDVVKARLDQQASEVDTMRAYVSGI